MTTDRDGVLARPSLHAEVDAFKRHRAVIEQAKGVLMQLLAIDEARAFAVLSRYSQDQNIKVHVLARRLTEAAACDATPSKDRAGEIQALLHDLAGHDP